ncbi:MAG: hypothetical protein ACKO7B_07120 [Flavobacteriales bacterium]
MISNKRRIVLILVSVSTGSLISLWIVKQRLGNLRQSDYLSLLFNFIFAAAVVVGLALLLQSMNKKDDNSPTKGNES